MLYKLSRVISLGTFALMILIPSLIVVFGSFKTDAEVYNKPLSLPSVWNLDNYRRLLGDSDLDVSFRNSVFVTVLSVALTLVFASLASYCTNGHCFKEDSCWHLRFGPRNSGANQHCSDLLYFQRFRFNKFILRFNPNQYNYNLADIHIHSDCLFPRNLQRNV